MRKAVCLGLALGLSLGFAGCSTGGGGDTPAQRTVDSMRGEMERCGLTSRDLYMIDLWSGAPPLWNQLSSLPCDQIDGWLTRYRAEHQPSLWFMVSNPMELNRPPGWEDLRYLFLHVWRPAEGSSRMTDAVLVDFDVGMVYSGPGLDFSINFDELQSVPLRSADAGALLKLLSEKTPAWPYPDVETGDWLPTDINVDSWQMAVVTRDKSLYRFDQTTVYSIAPDGFVEVYEAFWALAAA